MAQSDFITDIARYGLENDREKLLQVLGEFIDHSKKTKKVNLALQLQSILKESLRNTQTTNSVLKVVHNNTIEDREVSEFILEKLTSDYRFDDLVCNEDIKDELRFFVKEHQKIKELQRFELPVSNKVLFYGYSGCGKTLASYVLAGELQKMMVVVNIGAIISSKLGETSKNLAKIFRRIASEGSIVFFDEFDSIGKIRDYSQDHGEMKRVVNTILQLFDYLPQDSLVIAATNQINMIDEALLRRFDLKLHFELPNKIQIKQLIDRTLKSGMFNFDKEKEINKIIDLAQGLSYYSIQKTLISTIKRSVIDQDDKVVAISTKIDTTLWKKLLEKEKLDLKT